MLTVKCEPQLCGDEPKTAIVTGFTYEYDKEFDGDRLAKNDLTASTLQQLFKNDKNVSFWERTITGELVPYGDARAHRSRDGYDLYVHYFSFWIAIEMKSRNFGHNNYLVTASTEGEMFEVLKCEKTKELQEKGFMCWWASVYNDGKIRIWQLDYIDLNNLRGDYKTKPKYSCKQSEKITEYVYLLDANKSLIIDRINGNE